MPPIFRHVVPNVPALTAGNGKPCYDPQNGYPVYQIVPQFQVRFTGSLDLTAVANDPDITGGDPVTGPVIVPASTLNANIRGAFSTHVPYGELTLSTSSIGTVATVASLISANTPTMRTDKVYFYFDGLSVGFVWDSTKTDWQWFASIMAVEVGVYCGDYFAYSRCECGNIGAVWKSALGSVVGRIRAGQGQTLTYNPTSTPSKSWMATALGGIALQVTSTRQ